MNIEVISFPGMNGLARGHIDPSSRDKNASLKFKETYRNANSLAYACTSSLNIYRQYYPE